MSSKVRKLIGTVLMLVLVIIYALACIDFAPSQVHQAPKWLQPIIYLVLGLGWVLPAMVIIRWMSKGDQPNT